MKVFRNLTITIDKSNRPSFVKRVEVLLTDGWRRDLDAEEKASTMPGIDKDYYFACEKSGKRQAALLVLAPLDELTLSVANIVPREVGQLSINEYNLILKEFHDRFVLPVSRELELDLDITDDQQTIEDWISSDSAGALRQFSATANKSTGSAHPSDQKRWFDFVIAIVENHDNLDSESLFRFLTEEDNWPENIADKLCIEFEKEIALLRYFRGE